MTEIFVDREFSTDETSSVIDHVYYSTEEKKLFVQLMPRGDQASVLAGYENVPEDVFTALETINTNRLNGDENSSVGRYWNQWIKPYMKGLDTADLDLVTKDDERVLDSLSSFFAQSGKYAYGEISTPDATILPVDPPRQELRFGVTFVSSDGQDVTLSVKAYDVHDAVKRFNEAITVLGWEPVEVKSVTQFFV